jgi:hypothetical protein
MFTLSVPQMQETAMRTLSEAIADAMCRGLFVAFRRAPDREGIVCLDVWNLPAPDSSTANVNIHQTLSLADFTSCSGALVVKAIDSAVEQAEK